MIIEQTIEIPENHRIYFDVPSQIPAGRTKVALTIIDFPQAALSEHEPSTGPYSWRKLRGMFNDSGFSTEELFKERARDLLREEAKLFGKISAEALEAAANRGVTPAELGLEEFV
ncbi:hypothetical protein AGMMS49991_02820 [Spirochaetia bacterium]|nr:hypothetical protein AGMMS49991_02820 [Spirochaetia bacterium]